MAGAFPGVTNVAVFGQTEMSPVTCALSGEDALRKIGSVGKPVSIVAARIVDDDMKDVPPGEVGEIVYRGLSVMAGYWQNPPATADAFRGGWFHSGDLVRADEEGSGRTARVGYRPAGPLQAADRLHVVDALPRNASGKVMKTALRREYP